MRHAWMLLRLPVLFLIVIGIAGMHTLGHPRADAPYAHCAVGLPHSAHIVDVWAGEPALPAATAVLAASAEVVTRAGSEFRGGAGILLDPRAVCVAILATGLILFLAALRAARNRRRAATGGTWAAFGLAGRGPPWVPRIGLHLADLSVLRN